MTLTCLLTVVLTVLCFISIQIYLSGPLPNGMVRWQQYSIDSSLIHLISINLILDRFNLDLFVDLFLTCLRRDAFYIDGFIFHISYFRLVYFTMIPTFILLVIRMKNLTRPAIPGSKWCSWVQGHWPIFWVIAEIDRVDHLLVRMGQVSFCICWYLKCAYNWGY